MPYGGAVNVIHPRAAVSPAVPPARSGGRLAVLDGLRISAALMVAIYHYTGHETQIDYLWGEPREQAFPIFSDIFKYGFTGVELFFMISGFVICMSSWGRTPAQFVHSRIVRLFPAYWPAVLITAAVLHLWPSPFKAPPDLHTVVLNLTMLNAPVAAPPVDVVYWTLWVEARFYLLFAVCLLWRGLTFQRTLIFGYGWLIAAAIGSHVELPLLTTVLMPEYAPYFVAGIALFLIHRFGPDLRVWGLLGVSFALGLHYITGRAAVRDLNTITAFVLLALFFAALTAVALGYTARIQWRWLTTAGVLTYPFYLLHDYIGWTIIRATRDLAPRYVVLTAVVTAMLILAWLVHKLIEKPLAAALKARLGTSRPRPATKLPPAQPEPPAPAAPSNLPAPSASPAEVAPPLRAAFQEPFNAPTMEIPAYHR